MRDRKYVTMMDPFQIKYGNSVSGVLSVALLISDITWVTGTLIGLGESQYVSKGSLRHNTICANHCSLIALQQMYMLLSK